MSTHFESTHFASTHFASTHFARGVVRGEGGGSSRAAPKRVILPPKAPALEPSLEKRNIEILAIAMLLAVYSDHE